MDYGTNYTRIDHGTECALMLHVQSQLSHFRSGIYKPPYVQTLSKQVYVS